MKLFLLIVLFCATVNCLPAISGDGSSQGVVESVLGQLKECVDGSTSLCLKERALKYAEGLASARDVSIIDGISLIGTGSPRSARALEPLSEEPIARENQIEGRLFDTAIDFLDNHVIQFRMPKATVEDMKRSMEEEGRGKKKKLKKLLPILALLKLKIGALIPLFLGIIAFAAVKAVLLGKIALIVSGLILLKKLLASKHGHETYEVVAHPHHEETHYASAGHDEHGGGGGWGRSAQDLAYNAYANQS